MSKKKTPSCCLVIDASVSRAAGSLESKHPNGTRCREVLQAVRSICHRMAWSPEIKAEWDRHQSAFARTWLVSMMNLKKLRSVKDAESEPFREAILNHVSEEQVREIIVKDQHLIEAAFATDYRVLSLDETVRGHLGRLASHFEQLRAVIWANPIREELIDWLEEGAPVEEARQLGGWS